MRKQSRMTIMIGIAVLVSLLISACSSTNNTGNNSTPGATASCPSVSGLTGAGSTFDNPLFSQMFAPNNYPKTKCGVNVNYQSVSSGAGINRLLAHTVDFGATDTPLTDTQEQQSTGGTIIHIPVTLGRWPCPTPLRCFGTPQPDPGRHRQHLPRHHQVLG